MNSRLLIVFASALLTFFLAHYAGAQTKAAEAEPGGTKLGSITGRVLADGQPVLNASVQAARLNSSVQPRGVPVNDNGEFDVKGLEPGVYRVTAVAPSFVTAPDSEMETYYRVGDSVTLRMTKGGVITGKVSTADETPVVAVRVRAAMIGDISGKPPRSWGRSLEQVTDDRGIFRIFGLAPGNYVISAGGKGSSGYGMNAFDNDAPTYAPSATRDTAAEIIINGSEEKTVNIHYRGDTGHVVSGNVTAPASPNALWISINLARLVDAAPDIRMSTYQNAGGKGFAFSGVADGEYLIWAQYAPRGENFSSEAKRITVKGADVTGIELSAKSLASVAGEVILEASRLETCNEKRRPVYNEMLITIARNQKPAPKDPPQIPFFRSGQAAPDSAGKFMLRDLGAGQYQLEARFFARYWYLRSISGRGAIATSKEGAANDVTQNWLSLKAGDQITGVKVTLSEGAASLTGQVESARDQKNPAPLAFYLVPAEKDSTNDVLRFFSTRVEADGSFALDHLPPGRYRALAKAPAENEPSNTTALRLPDAAETRIKLRREAEGAKFELTLQPCENVSGYQITVK